MQTKPTDIPVSAPARPLAYRFCKRALDIAVSLCALAAGLVPGLVLALAVALDTGGSPVYAQWRAGRAGRPFRILKFRTMYADSDDVGAYLTPEQLEQWGRERKVDGDPRVTRLGAVLRATSIDELPQFLNVLAGQMSVVGPRPVAFEELSWYGRDRDLLLSVPPGVTGLWQTGPRNLATYESGERQRLELSYVRQACLSLDARLFFRTFSALWRRTGR